MPMPMPPTMKPARRVVHDECAPTPCIRRSEAPTSVIPTAKSIRMGRKDESRPEIGATTNESSVTGMKRMPDSSAL